MASVAEVLVETLVQAGVRRIYGVSGDSLNSIVDAVRRHDGIEWVLVRDEEAGAFAAGAEAQLTGKLAVCAGSCGPGNLHLINGLYDCHRTGAPVLAIAAHIPSGEIGTSYFQETHPERLFIECSHLCELLFNGKQMPRLAQVAVQTSLSRGGVSVLVIPGDVAMQKVDDESLRHEPFLVQPSVRPSDRDLKDLAALLNGSAKVTMLCGRGCAGAHSEVMELSSVLQAPIVHSLAGKEHIEHNSPNDVGLTGLIGISSAQHALDSCEVLLMLGTDFPYTNFYPKNAKIAQVDRKPEHLGRRCKLTLGLAGNVRETVEALLPLIERKPEGQHLSECLQKFYKARHSLAESAAVKPGQKPINPETVAAIVNDLASTSAIFTADTGMSTVWASRYIKMTRDRRFIGSWNHGTMANALPQAIGAQLANPHRQVVALCGDGGLGMLLGELLTVAQYDLPVKMIVFNNSSLGMVKLEMQVAGLPEHAVDYSKSVDYAALARAAGMQATRVEDPENLTEAIAQALDHRGPALVDAVTDPMRLAMPPHITVEQALGFSVYLLKQTLSGNVKAPLQLAESNLR